MKKKMYFALPLLAWSLTTFAQGMPMPPHPMPMEMGTPAPAPEADQAVDAMVRKVDRKGARVMLSHDPVPRLHMTAMTMYFPVRDPSQLQGLKPAMKVKVVFAEQDGQTVVVHIAPAE